MIKKVFIGILIIALIGLTGSMLKSRYYGLQYESKLSSCISNVKDLGTSANLYAADYDDRLPPYYAFSEKPGKESIILKESLAKYLRSSQSRCPADSESQFTDFGYVNPHSLIGLIPMFTNGKRVLKLADIENASKTPYLRDPVRGNAVVEQADKSKVNALTSPHGAAFMIGYIDSHVSRKTTLDIRADL